MVFVTNRIAGAKYNISDLNRVEANVQTLADTLVGYGYTISVDTYSTWLETMFFTDESNESRFIGNLQEFKDNFYLSTEVIPSTMKLLTWQNANNIEKLLEKVYNNIINMEKSFKKSGTFKSGQVIIL